MTDHRPDPTRPHATHDPELVAAYAAGDAAGADLASAQALVAGCSECAQLHRDLRAITAALPTLPAPVRPRDFRIAPEVAATLRRPSGLRGLLAPLASARFGFAAPAGAALAALGLAGILLSGSVNLGFGLGGSTAALTTVGASVGGEASGPSGAAPVAAGATAGPTAGPAFDKETDSPPRFVVPSEAGPISRDAAIAIARTAAHGHENDAVLAADLLRYRDVVNLGWVLGPLDGQGTTVVVDAVDGHVVQAVDWIS